MRRRTLTTLLFMRITPIILAVIAGVGVLAFFSASREINHVYDTQLKNNADVLWQLVKEEFQEEAQKAGGVARLGDVPDTESTPSAIDDDDRFGNARMFRIWKGKQVVMMSDTGFDPHIPRVGDGFANVPYKNERWRLFTMHIPQSDVWIEVGEKTALREQLVAKILVDLFVPLLVVIPLIGLVLWHGIRGGLGITRALIGQIQSRTPDDLAPISVERLPADLLPLGNSINRLFIKLAQSIHAERRFADHAAHQLRTPLAGSKLLIQMLATVEDEQERKLILEDLAASNEQSAQLVSKLLIGARISHQALSLHPLPVYPAIAQVIADMAPLAAQKNLRISLEGDETVEANADGTLFSLLIGNLIENAIKYTPEHGFVRVSVAGGGRCHIAIHDSGPGIAEAEKPLVFERFYRGETPNIDGAGLGLAIVADIIERFGGTIALVTPPEGGLRVEIGLPLAD